MKTEDKYLSFVQWSEPDQLYVGYCPDLFPAGGVCHGASSVDAYEKLVEIIEDMVATAKEQNIPLPEPRIRAMREIELAS